MKKLPIVTAYLAIVVLFGVLAGCSSHQANSRMGIAATTDIPIAQAEVGSVGEPVQSVPTAIIQAAPTESLTDVGTGQAKPEPPPCAQQPKIVFSETSYDFGKAEPGDKVSHTFRFSNKGYSPLQITNIRTNCGCTATNLGKKLLAANEFSELAVTLNVGKRPGRKTKNVTIISNDPIDPKIVLKISADVQQQCAQAEKAKKPVEQEIARQNHHPQRTKCASHSANSNKIVRRLRQYAR